MLFAVTTALAAALGSAPCAGADLAITNVAVKSVADEGNVNRYTLIGTVVNVGSKGQAPNVLQSIEIYRNGVKAGVKGVPPLRARQTYRFTYVIARSDEAAQGTTPVRFVLHVQQPSPPGAQECNPANDRFTVAI